MGLVHGRMDEPAGGRVIFGNEPAVSAAFERINHDHRLVALLDSKCDVGLGLIAGDADGIDGHVHRGEVDAAVVANMILDGLSNQIRIAAGSEIRYGRGRR